MQQILLSLVHLAIVTFARHFAWKSTLNRERCLCQERRLAVFFRTFFDTHAGKVGDVSEQALIK
ncbi:hypothetical protein P608_25110 [Comamonas thiooxydans]|uniref:Uncharacterized protein n=1 Tax=Comamonas thiooxydans TaxID=363952 RepID=A0A0E3CAT9_9BURK|nr:hypothetical protein P608_25110 [Comamonas thiooxydans]KGH18901.1 hypothetical protein P606_24225 [Comamonas thiooxydans]